MPTSPQPGPSRGLFETVLVVAGQPVALEAHLDRLAAGLDAVGAALPTTIAADAIAACTGIELGRLRIDAGPVHDGGLHMRYEATPIDPNTFFSDWEHGERLRGVSAEGWPGGPYKWAERGWLEDVERRLTGEAPLLVDATGNVLEAGRANLFIANEGALATPPADGRILPGTARAATLALAAELGIEANERPLALAELGEADEVFLTSSVKGLRPVRYLDGTELRRRGAVVERLAAELRERWLSALF